MDEAAVIMIIILVVAGLLGGMIYLGMSSGSDVTNFYTYNKTKLVCVEHKDWGANKPYTYNCYKMQ